MNIRFFQGEHSICLFIEQALPSDCMINLYRESVSSVLHLVMSYFVANVQGMFNEQILECW